MNSCFSCWRRDTTSGSTVDRGCLRTVPWVRLGAHPSSSGAAEDSRLENSRRGYVESTHGRENKGSSGIVRPTCHLASSDRTNEDSGDNPSRGGSYSTFHPDRVRTSASSRETCNERTGLESGGSVLTEGVSDVSRGRVHHCTPGDTVVKRGRRHPFSCYGGHVLSKEEGRISTYLGWTTSEPRTGGRLQRS